MAHSIFCPIKRGKCVGKHCEFIMKCSNSKCGGHCAVTEFMRTVIENAHMMELDDEVDISYIG